MVTALVDTYLEKYAKPRKKSWKLDQRILNVELVPVLGKTRARDVKRSSESAGHALESFPLLLDPFFIIFFMAWSPYVCFWFHRQNHLSADEAMLQFQLTFGLLPFENNAFMFLISNYTGV